MAFPKIRNWSTTLLIDTSHSHASIITLIVMIIYIIIIIIIIIII